MRPLELNLLGQFEGSLGADERISLPTRKIEVLLAYLAMAPGLRQPRERLINLLWSDRGEEQARNSLRQALSALKKALGDSADLILQVDRSTVAVKPELIEVDVHEFDRLALEGDYESLATAADLYQGEFLEGISIRDPACQEWLDSERARFKRQFIEILTNLTETQLFSHDFEHAIRSAERLVRQDPLNEAGWRLLMRSYADHGDRNHALQAFKRCQQVLHDELEIEPEAATLELRERIAAGAARQPPAIDTAVATGPPAVIEPADSAESPAPATTSAPPVSTDHSIAVLPFDNLSGDPEQEYFSDGITDSIILNLSLFPGLSVKSRNSSFAFKQQIKSLGEISRELDVDYIVEGSIRKSGDRIRITVQLIEAASGHQVWGKRYDAELDNLFDLEEDLSRSIAATVTGQIESDLQRIAVAKGAAGQESYDLLLSGLYHVLRYNQQDSLIAIEKLEQCLAQDPDNVRAHVYLYGCHLMSYLERWTEDYRASFVKAAEHIKKALALSPESALVQTYYAEYLIFNDEADRAIAYLDKALQINPNDTDALTVKAFLLENIGEFEASLELIDYSLKLDPYHPWAEWELSVCNYYCGNYEAAIKAVENARTSPSFTRIFSVAAKLKLGRTEPARQELRTFLAECRENMRSMPQTVEEWSAYIRDNYVFKDPGLNESLIDCLKQAGLEAELTAPRLDADETHSIVVLPFDNLSGDPNQEYFSDGITESVIINLSLFPGLSVKSRNASFAFKEQLKTPGEISRELEVDYVVEGSIRKSDDRVRVTVQLFEASSGNQVWGKRYDSEIGDLFDLEEDLSRTIASTVTGQIESDLQRIAITKGAANQQAYDLLLAGEYHLGHPNSSDNQLAIDKLNQCIALDPDNVRAHGVLYYCHNLNLMDRWVEDFEQSRKLVEEHILKAVSLNPDLDYVQVAYGEYLTFQHRYDEAERQLRQVLANNPNDAEAVAQLAVNLSSQGKAEAALEQAELAIRLDPYQSWYNWIKSESLLFCERYEDCLATIRDIGNAPGFIRIYTVAANVRLGRLDAARKALGEFLEFCRENMLSMPRNIEEWRQYYRDNAPLVDPAVNDDIIDCLVQAGLEESFAPRLTTGSGKDLPSILVLPFSNLSGDPEQEYFSDGITDSIIVSLSSFGGIQVKSRHTSIAFRDSSKSIDEIGAELGVQYIVEGSIRKFGDNIRISVNLDEAAGGDQLWGKRFDTRLEDLFELEEELVQTIAGTISGRIGKELKSASLQKPTKDLKSYDYLLRGIYHLEKYNCNDNLIAQQQFQKCLEHDPDNAEAHAYLGAFYVIDIYENWSPDREESKRLMLSHAEKAIELEPDNAHAHAYLAEALMMHHEFDRAEVHADRAIELNPAMPDGYAIKGFVMGSTRRYAEAIENAEISLKIDPHHPYMSWSAGEVFRGCGQYERAVKTFRSMPHCPPSVYAQTAAALAGLDKIDEARSEMNRYLESARSNMPKLPKSESEWRAIWQDTMPYQYQEDADTLFELLLKASLCDDLPESANNVPSIAVLPFENISGDPEQEYFSDGITASTILSLGLYKGLTVKSQNSSFAYKNSGKSSEEIAEALSVDYLVEGSIRKSAGRVRISVQLIETVNGNQIWGKQYNAELEDILELEQELSQTVAATISGRIGHTLQQSAARKPASNLQSYDYLLRGLYHLGRFTAPELETARQEVEKCLEIDPDSAAAHFNLGVIHFVEALEGWTTDRQTSEKLAGHHLSTALQLEPDNAAAHAYMADYLNWIGDFVQSEFHADRAIDLNPTAAEGYFVKADLLRFTRRVEEAIPYADKSLQLDPHSVGAGWAAGGVYLAAGQYDKAIRTFRSISHPPASLHAQIAACFAGLGLADEARREMKRYQQLAGQQMPAYPKSEDEWRALWRDYSCIQYDEDFDELFELLKQAGLCEELVGSSAEIPSIAVLPFENMSGDPEQEHFSDGITADIVDTLSKFKHLRTVSRHSTLPYKFDKPSIADIAREQKVRYILEGSVRKSGDRVRVNAELLDARGEKILWSERFDRDLDDLFAVQDEITREIALALKVQLDDGEMARVRSKGATHIRAWELTMAAVDLQDTYIRQNLLDARALAAEATALDPDYAYAWISLGWTYWQEYYAGLTDSLDTSIDEAEKAVRRAREIDPEYSEAYSLAGMIHLMKHEAGAAIEDCLKAVALEPGNAEIQGLTAFAYVFAGDYATARQYEQNIRKLCPLRANWYFLIEGQIEVESGNLERAAEIYREGLDVEPESPLCRYFLIDLMLQLGDEAAARQYADEIRGLEMAASARGVAHTYSADPALRDAFRARLAKFDLV